MAGFTNVLLLALYPTVGGTMKTLFILASVMVVLFLGAPNKIEAQQKKPITNPDIVAMVKAGLPESTIVVAIQQSPANFDTSPQALIELKTQGVTPKIIETMLQAGAPTTTAQPVPQPQTNNPLSNQQSPVVVFIDATGRTEMKYSPSDMDYKIGAMAIVAFGSTKIKTTIKGKDARLRTTTTTPSFEASTPSNAYPTDQIGLVKLTPKSDKREIETGKIATFSPGSSGFKTKDIVPIAIEEIKEQNTSGSFYKRYSIKTVNPLPPGEYALVVGGSYYDFGVDSNK
jgi:hypothetical protein